MNTKIDNSEHNEKYYLIETEGSREGFVLFWVVEGHGYTINLEEAGLFDYDFVKEHYLGQSKETLAIEEKEFKGMMQTYKIVWNHAQILRNNKLFEKIFKKERKYDT